MGSGKNESSTPLATFRPRVGTPSQAWSGSLTRVLARVRDEPHIIECHALSGSYDYLMKVVARNMDHFSDLCIRKILKFPGVSNVQSSFSLDEVKVDAPLPT